MENKLTILGIPGSLRAGSYNRGLLEAAAELMPEGMTLEIADISGIALYNEDDFKAGVPETVLKLKEKIRLADGLLIATPEYNRSIPGVLKNAMDWISRPRNAQPFSGKPLAMMGAGGRSGTVGAQTHLRQVAEALGMKILGEPEVAIQRAWEKFDAHGNLVDQNTRQLVEAQMAAFKEFVIREREADMAAGVLA